mmetsp:Transcript_25631/g.64570  ORF Transcript_25631/g.64570 Transcript_25631/m.64570 type:complete len:207 (+) Transcript_25631:204-824(+)
MWSNFVTPRQWRSFLFHHVSRVALSFSTRDHVSHPHTATGRTNAFRILTFSLEGVRGLLKTPVSSPHFFCARLIRLSMSCSSRQSSVKIVPKYSNSFCRLISPWVVLITLVVSSWPPNTMNFVFVKFTSRPNWCKSEQTRSESCASPCKVSSSRTVSSANSKSRRDCSRVASPASSPLSVKATPAAVLLSALVFGKCSKTKFATRL